MKTIKSIYEKGGIGADGKSILKNTTKSAPGHELYKKNPSIHAGGASATGNNLKQIVDAINGSGDIKKILPTNIKNVPMFKDAKYAPLYNAANPMSGGTYSNLDAQSGFDSYQSFLSNLGSNK